MLYDKGRFYHNDDSELTFAEFQLWDFYYSNIRDSRADRNEYCAASIADAVFKSVGSKKSNIEMHLPNWKKREKEVLKVINGDQKENRNAGPDHALLMMQAGVVRRG